MFKKVYNVKIYDFFHLNTNIYNLRNKFGLICLHDVILNRTRLENRTHFKRCQDLTPITYCVRVFDSDNNVREEDRYKVTKGEISPAKTF